MSNVQWKARGFDTIFVFVTAGLMWLADNLLGVSDALAVLPKWRVVLHLGLTIGWGVLISWWINVYRKRFEAPKNSR